MISKYVKEQKRYTQDELRKIFECTADETVQIIRKLKECILRSSAVAILF